jgi:hypothetical protein
MLDQVGSMNERLKPVIGRSRRGNVLLLKNSRRKLLCWSSVNVLVGGG